LPGKSGLDFQRELAATNRDLLIILISVHGDVPMSVRAMKAGAVEFLTKPLREQDVLDAVEVGLARDRARRENERALATLGQRFGSLSTREREIMIQVARPPQQADCRRFRHCRRHGEGASQPSYAKDESQFASRAHPNGRSAQAGP
jgi:FixJ family two-component response regulator